MKKFILISSLLAAGTLAASAATQITATTYLNFDGAAISDNSNGQGFNGVNASNTGTNSDLSVAISAGYANFTSGLADARAFTSTSASNNYLILTNTGISWTSSWTIGFSFALNSGGSFNDWAYLFGISDASSSATNYLNIETKSDDSKSVGLFGTEGMSTPFSLTNSAKNVDITGDPVKIALTYSYDSTSGGSLTLYVNGTAVSTGTVSVAGAMAATISELRLGSGVGTNDKHAGTYDEFVIYDAALTAAQVSTYLSDGTKASPLTISLIPEPSLFGLFAGTLALGLAGTRRRRNRAGTQK